MQTGSQFTNSPTLHSRAAAQTPLHKMYTFVYRTFIKFMFFCRGQALDASESALCRSWVKWRFNALMGLSCYKGSDNKDQPYRSVSMPSWAWVVTARMSNILNFSWYFLCIPAIYRCILAYLPIFFNQLSKFLRCESPSTFLGTCLSHHSFIIFLVTNTNTLLSGLYLISTVPLQKPRFYAVSRACFCRYLSEYSDNRCFSCMLTFWTYLMRCTYPWHWI